MQNEGPFRDNLLSPSSPTHLLDITHKARSATESRQANSADLSGAVCREGLVSFVERESTQE